MEITEDSVTLTDKFGNIIALIDRDSLGTGNIVNINVAENIPSSNDFQLNSQSIEIYLLDAFGNKVQPNGSVEICIPPSSESDEEKCLGFYNEFKSKWECESCIHEEENGFLCGKTDHFTQFAILLDLGGSGVDSLCGPDGNAYITGSFLGDSLLIASFAAAMCCIILLCILIGTRIPRIHGMEHARIQYIRTSLSKRMRSTIMDPKYSD